MKSLVFFLLLSIQAFCQTNNFSVKGSSLIWENVFISNETNISAVLAKHPRLKIDSTAGKLHKGNAVKIKNTCPETSLFMNDEISFDFEIEESTGKYRVTVTNIKFTNKGKSKNAESYLIEKGAIKTGSIVQNDIECIENYLNRTFTLTQILNNKM